MVGHMHSLLLYTAVCLSLAFMYCCLLAVSICEVKGKAAKCVLTWIICQNRRCNKLNQFVVHVVMFKNRAAVYLDPIKHVLRDFWMASKTFHSKRLSWESGQRFKLWGEDILAYKKNKLYLISILYIKMWVAKLVKICLCFCEVVSSNFWPFDKQRSRLSRGSKLHWSLRS